MAALSLGLPAARTRRIGVWVPAGHFQATHFCPAPAHCCWKPSAVQRSACVTCKVEKLLTDKFFFGCLQLTEHCYACNGGLGYFDVYQQERTGRARVAGDGEAGGGGGQRSGGSVCALHVLCRRALLCSCLDVPGPNFGLTRSAPLDGTVAAHTRNVPWLGMLRQLPPQSINYKERSALG